MVIYVDGGLFFSGKVKDLQALLSQLQQKQTTLAQLIKQNMH